MSFKPIDISEKNLQELIEGAIAKQRVSQKALYEMLSSKMMILCLRYTRSREEAEEVLQDGFLRVFRHLDQYKGSGSFEGWVRKIMINCALQKLRVAPHLFQTLDSAFHPENKDSGQDCYSRLSEKELMRAVQNLPHACRLVFNLYVFEGLKHREIAVVLGISEGTSKSNLFDARHLLKKAIGLTRITVNQ